MQIIVLQRLPKELEAVEKAMKEICPELLERTTFKSYLSDVKEMISTKKKFLAKREHKEVLVVTSTILTDESMPRITNKIKNWNDDAEIIVFSYSPENALENKKIKKKISALFVKSCDKQSKLQLASHIKMRWEEKMKK